MINEFRLPRVGGIFILGIDSLAKGEE